MMLGIGVRIEPVMTQLYNRPGPPEEVGMLVITLVLEAYADAQTRAVSWRVNVCGCAHALSRSLSQT